MICIYELTHELTTNGKEKKNVAMLKALTAVGALMTLIDFTLSNATRFYWTNGEPLCSERFNDVPINPLTAERMLRAPIDFTLSNARRFLLVNGEPLGRERVKHLLSR